MSTITDLRAGLAPEQAGERMYQLMRELFPICRSITGEGFRQTLAVLQRRLPGLALNAVPSGTQCFDWTVPKEWNVRDAWVADSRGRRVIDFKANNLHLLNYSVPVRARMTKAELLPHLHSLPEHPGWIPYRTSYYQERWGFCLAHEQLAALPDDTYEVVIDSTLEDGVLNWGELFLPGTGEGEVLVSCHACHPSLCNDNLSGVVLTTALAELLSSVEHRLGYRFVWIPGGIGSVVWLSRNEALLPRIRAGLVVTCVGDPGPFTYKLSRRADTLIDRAVKNVLARSGRPHEVIDFSPYGYDERNYCSAKFDLPVGSLTRTTHGRFAGYHSSGDGLDFVQPGALGESLAVYLDVLDVLEGEGRYRNLLPEAEPQLGKRGLYGMTGGLQQRDRLEVAMLWVMNQSDGRHSLLDVSERSGLPFDLLRQAAGLLVEHGLLEPLDELLGEPLVEPLAGPANGGDAVPAPAPAAPPTTTPAAAPTATPGKGKRRAAGPAPADR